MRSVLASNTNKESHSLVGLSLIGVLLKPWPAFISQEIVFYLTKIQQNKTVKMEKRKQFEVVEQKI